MTKPLLLALLALAATGCHKEPVYETRIKYCIVLEKSMHESWTGDDFYARVRYVQGGLGFEKIEKLTYYGCHIGDTIAIPYQVQVGTQTEFL